MKKTLARKIVLLIIMSLVLVGCKKTEPATAQDAVEVEVYESADGWKLSYDTGKFFLNDTLGEGEICFNYTGECAGTTAVFVSYHPGMMPDEILYEKVASIDDSLIERGEAMFDGYWSHYRNVLPENEDPDAGDVVYEDFTAIEHNDGTVLIDYLRHLETDDAQKSEIDDAISGLLDSFELVNHSPQTEYAHIPGKYTRQYSDEIGNDKIEIEDIIELKEDHSCSLTFQDTVTGQWTGTMIILDNGTEYEFSVEGSTLYLNMDGEWVPFENENFESEAAPLGAADYSKYTGEYQDSFSQRATMSAEALKDALKLTVHWSSSATEFSIWTMTAKFTSPDKLSYTDCENGIVVFEDNGTDTYTKKYDSGKGYFTVNDGKLLWDGAAEESCRDCVFENPNYGYPTGGNEIRYIMENVDLENLPDGTYPVKIFFDKMKRNKDSLALDFMIYTTVRYAPEDIRNMKRDDIVYEYVDEVTTENYIIDTVNFPIDEVCVVNGGSERGEGITFSLDKSGYFIVSVAEGYTRHASHGMVNLEIPDSVTFEDNHDLKDSKLQGEALYTYFKGLSAAEKEYFNENNTFITVSKGKVTAFYRIYLP